MSYNFIDKLFTFINLTEFGFDFN